MSKVDSRLSDSNPALRALFIVVNIATIARTKTNSIDFLLLLVVVKYHTKPAAAIETRNMYLVPIAI